MFGSRVPSASALELALSAPRFQRYLSACSQDILKASQLYSWNANVAAAFMLPIHFAEISARNAAHQALENTYGADWPFNRNFFHSLPTSSTGYNPRHDLGHTVARLTNQLGSQPSTGKVIAELKFVFWVQLFTKRQDNRIWKKNILSVLPDSGLSDPAVLRKSVYTALDNTRQIRNRIAHHEPIYMRDLTRDLEQMMRLVSYRSKEIGLWLEEMEGVSSLLISRPLG